MLHKERRWHVAHYDTSVGSISKLAYELTQCSWCGCNGFRIGDVIFLNDSTSADGAQEFAAIDADTGRQFESITFGWMNEGEAFRMISQMLRWPKEERRDITPSWWGPQGYDWRESIDETHRRCALCA